MMNKFSIIVAATDKLGIGCNGAIPWKLPEDLKYFRDKTTNTDDKTKLNAVIMGRKSFESIPEKYRPLKGRINYILSHDESIKEKYKDTDVIVCSCLDEALLKAFNRIEKPLIEKVYIIGGGQVYKQAIELPECQEILITKIHKDFECDTYFPEIPDYFELSSTSDEHIQNDTKFNFYTYTKKNNYHIPFPILRQTYDEHEEYQYLHMIEYILKYGNLRGDRTGTGTRSYFGTQMRYSLRNNVIPVLTTKKVFWRGVVEELLWFIRGDTNMYNLKDKNIHIWDGNGSREFLDTVGLTDREEGDLGPIYGFQWRHFGADYTTMHDDYTNKGIDQIKQIIHTLKTNPTDRRIILSAWNPAAISKMALPPCHVMCQFYVNNGELSCQMYQRSADMGLGVPFNIASYSLLTHLLCHICNLKPGEFIHVMGDTHVYINHRDALLTQLQREPRSFPTLKINATHDDINDFVFSDFELIDYNPYGAIKMKMAV